MTEPELEAATSRIEYLAARCEAIGDAQLRADVLELMGLILELHGSGLRRMLAAVDAAPHLEAALAAWGRDAEVAGLCELHGVAIPRRRAPSAPGFVPLEELTLR